MKYLLIGLVCAGVAAMSHAVFGAPFLICDPDPSGTFDTVAYQEGTSVTRSPLIAGACHADVGPQFSVPGKHSLTVWFESSLNGAKSVSAIFTFTPAANGAPGPAGLGVSAK